MKRVRQILQMREQKVVVIDHVASGKKARELRLNTGHSLRSVAAYMGYSAPYLSDLENGKRNWSPVLAEQFLIALDNMKV